MPSWADSKESSDDDMVHFDDEVRPIHCTLSDSLVGDFRLASRFRTPPSHSSASSPPIRTHSHLLRSPPDLAARTVRPSTRRRGDMATFELYRRSTIGMCLTETLDEMVSSGTLSPELAIQVLVQFDKSMTEALENQVKSKVTVKGHLHTYRFCDNVWTFILTDAHFKNEEITEQVSKVKIVACDSKLLSQ
ncbi:hypothetical protein ZWY2020_055036 [Hordeum vulgare]|nr:hypothetical protein ZWY2020_055036 [Hordeum vulgare]